MNIQRSQQRQQRRARPSQAGQAGPPLLLVHMLLLYVICNSPFVLVSLHLISYIIYYLFGTWSYNLSLFVLGWYCVGQRLVFGSYSDGIRMVFGWYPNGIGMYSEVIRMIFGWYTDGIRMVFG